MVPGPVAPILQVPSPVVPIQTMIPPNPNSLVGNSGVIGYR